MNLLFFYSQMPRSDFLENTSSLIRAIRDRSAAMVHVVCEHKESKKELEAVLGANKDIFFHVIDLHSDDSLKAEPYPGAINHYYGIDTLFLNNFREAFDKRYDFFRRFVDTVKIDAAVYWNHGEAFRGISVIALDRALDFSGKRLFFIGQSPFKGRLLVYDNIQYQLKKLEDDFEDCLSAVRSDRKIKKSMEQFFSTYMRFKKEKFYEHSFIKPRNLTAVQKLRRAGRNLKPSVAVENLYRTLNKEQSLLVKKQPSFHEIKSQPFILFLTNKLESWANQLMCPFYADEAMAVNAVWQSLPRGVKLVVKDHPLSSYPHVQREGIYRLCNKHDDIHYIMHDGATEEWVEHAQAVTGLSSTAKVEAVFQMKTIVTIEESSAFFPKSAPHLQAESPNSLPDLIKASLNHKVDPDRAYAYVYSYLRNSVTSDDGMSAYDIPEVFANKREKKWEILSDLLVRRLGPQ